MREIEITQGYFSGNDDVEDIIYALGEKAPNIENVVIFTLEFSPAYLCFSKVRHLAVNGGR